MQDILDKATLPRQDCKTKQIIRKNQPRILKLFNVNLKVKLHEEVVVVEAAVPPAISAMW